jgi:hypothetical protein
MSEFLQIVFMLHMDAHKGKSKAVPVLNKHHALKAYCGSGGIAPLIL